jgi:hypothetical protein
MIPSIILSLSLFFSAPYIEEERVGAKISLASASFKDFKPFIGVGVDIIFVTDDKLGASLGILFLRNKGESIYSEPLPGTEIYSATSAKYLTQTGFELNYCIKRNRISPFTGVGINWIFFHEQSKFIYHAPGWVITTWKSYHGNGYVITGIAGFRYILKPSVALEIKTSAVYGGYHYPIINKYTALKGVSLSLGIRL